MTSEFSLINLNNSGKACVKLKKKIEFAKLLSLIEILLCLFFLKKTK